jgi:thioredoxin 1
MKYIESLEDFEELLSASDDTICVVDIFAEWCGPCKRIAPTFEKVAEEHTSFRFFKYDADLNLDVEELRVSSLPTFLVFHQRKIINTLVGGNIERFLSMINEL